MGAVDCERDKARCGKEGVDSYPAIKLYKARMLLRERGKERGRRREGEGVGGGRERGREEMGKGPVPGHEALRGACPDQGEPGLECGPLGP